MSVRVTQYQTKKKLLIAYTRRETMENCSKFVFGKDKKLKLLKVFHRFTNLLSSIEHEKHFNWFFWFNTVACKSVCVRAWIWVASGFLSQLIIEREGESEMRIPQQILKIEKKEIHDIGMIVMNFLSVFLSILPSFILFRLCCCQFLFSFFVWMYCYFCVIIVINLFPGHASACL